MYMARLAVIVAPPCSSALFDATLPICGARLHPWALSDAKLDAKKPDCLWQSGLYLVGRGRLERPTNGLKVRCSTN